MLEIVNILYELYLIKHNIFNIKSIYGPKPKLRIEGMHDRGASSYPPPSFASHNLHGGARTRAYTEINMGEGQR